MLAAAQPTARPCLARGQGAHAARCPQRPARAQASSGAAQAGEADGISRRQHLAAVALLVASSCGGAARADRFDDELVTSASGMRVLDIRDGDGATPKPGDIVEVHWSGVTKGYQGKRIDNTSLRDEPYVFRLGAHEAIPAFEEAVAGMKAGGIRRIEVPGDRPELGYPRDRKARFTDSVFRDRIYKYRFGPQPVELGGQRALDFVLDNETLPDFNRDLLFDIKLLQVRRGK